MLTQDITEYAHSILNTDNDSINYIIKELIELGLTQNEAKVYMYLAKYGARKAIEVSKALNIPRTETYHLLSKLQGKGLVMVIMQHPTKYTAIPFEQTIHALIGTLEEKVKSFEKKRNQLLMCWQTLPETASNIENERDKLQILEGKTAVYTKVKELCKEAHDEILIHANEKEILRFYHYDVFDELNKNVNIKILTDLSNKFASILKEINANVNIKYVNAPSFIIKDYDEVLLFLNEENNIAALWTNCRAIVQSIALLFEKLDC